jgi:RNA polymerase sigma factor (sigma-70 family)
VPTINPPPPPGENPRDTALLEQLAQARACEDTAAERLVTGELIAGWQPRVEALGHFKGLEPHQVDDPVGRWSERMVRALAKRTSFDGPFGAVAMMNANWACSDERGQGHLTREQLAAEPRVVDDGDPSGAIDEASDVQAAIDAALASLSGRERAIIDGVYHDGKKHKEIAVELGMTAGAVKTALCRALGKVRTQLREAGVTNRGRSPV